MWAQLSGNAIAVNLGLTLLHSLWQIGLLGLLAWLLLAVLRKATAQARYVVACAAMALMFAVPLGTFLYLESGVDAPGVEPIAPMSMDGPAADAPRDFVAAPGGAEEPAAAAAETVPFVAEKTVGELIRPLAYRFAPYATLAWMAGVLLLLVRLVAGHLFYQLLRHRHATPAPKALQERVDGLGAKIGVGRPVGLLTSARVAVPMVVGWLKPVIMVPPALLAGMPVEQLEGVLLHELAHIRRFDPVVNFVQSIIETLLFYHPVTWWLSKQIRNERENCCDDIALSASGDATKYAESLLSVMTYMTSTPSFALSSTGGEATNRIRRILGMTTRTEHANRAGVGSGLTLLAALATVLAFLHTAQPANAASSQLLVFPLEESVGEVYTRDARKDWEAEDQYMGFEQGWEKFAEAKGDVTVPANREAMLKPTTTDLAYLEWQAPDALFALNLERLELTDGDLSPIARLTGLKGLRFWSCKSISDGGMDILNALTDLEYLVLDGCQVREVPQLAQMGGNLKVFEAFATLFNDAGVANLVAASPWQLGWLSLERTRVTDTGLASLAKLPYLKGLTLEEMPVTHDGLRYLAAIEGLENLNLMSVELTDEDLYALAGMKDLRHLILQDNSLTDKSMEFLLTFPALQNLDLARTKVTDNGVNTLLRSETLWNVNLDHTKVSDAKAKELALRFVQNRTDVPMAAKAQASTNPNAPKVGFFLSHYTATGPHWMPQRYGYTREVTDVLIKMLEAANYDVYAIVEPDTEALGELPVILAEMGLSEKTITATDVRSLKTLDVVFAYRICNVHEEVISALLSAAKSGVGMVVMRGFGNVRPGNENDLVKEFEGMVRPEYAWWGNGPLEFEVVKSHPILSDLQPGTKFRLGHYNGHFDLAGPPVDSEVLIDSVEGNRIPFIPLFVREYGSGRIVRCVWHNVALDDWPYPIEEFYTRCVNWAAKEPVETKW